MALETFPSSNGDLRLVGRVLIGSGSLVILFIRIGPRLSVGMCYKNKESVI